MVRIKQEISQSNVQVKKRGIMMDIKNGILKRVYQSDVKDYTVQIPFSVQKIGTNAFCNLMNFRKIMIPRSVKKLHTKSFSNCRDFQMIEIKNEKCKISNCAFKCCENLEEVYMPNKLQYIRNNMFVNCDNISKIHYKGHIYSIDDLREYERL